MDRRINLAGLALAVLLTASPTVADPNAQLTLGVARRLAVYGIEVDPDRLTTAQASALHLLLVSERGYVNVRQRAEAILRNPDFRD